jgi:hypothetical protein
VGIEPTLLAWEANVLPLNDARIKNTTRHSVWHNTLYRQFFYYLRLIIEKAMDRNLINLTIPTLKKQNTSKVLSKSFRLIEITPLA